MNAWINFTWYDELRTWSPADYSGVNIIFPEPGDIWVPAPMLINSAVDLDLFAGKLANLFIVNDGHTEWQPGSLMLFSCTMIFTYFPFDRHKCTMIFMFQAMHEDLNFIESTSNSYETPDFITNGEWDLLNTEFIPNIFTYQYAISCFHLVLTLQRRPEYYVINVIMPIQLISLLSCFVYVLPLDGGERAGFSTTMLLSLTVLMGTISDKLPNKSDYIPLIVMYVYSMCLLSVVGVIATVVQLKAVKNDKGERSLTECGTDDGWPQTKKRFWPCRAQSTSAVLFSAHLTIFLLLNVCFLGTMMYGNGDDGLVMSDSSY